ncbi:OPT super [Coemansia sp. RSA 2049]|nr:OPT super [Coemansia sp. RSA 2049]
MGNREDATPPQLPPIAFHYDPCRYSFSEDSGEPFSSHTASWLGSAPEANSNSNTSVCKENACSPRPEQKQQLPPAIPASSETMVESRVAVGTFQPQSSSSSSSSSFENKNFAPSWKAWAYALTFTTMFAFISPVFLFRAYTMPVTPLMIPVSLYLLCQLSGTQQPDHTACATGSSRQSEETTAANSSSSITTRITAQQYARKLKRHAHGCWLALTRWRPNLGKLSRQEVVWITSMVAAGGSFAPAYQWIATIDSDYGHLLSHWQQLTVVLGTQLLGWSLGLMLNRVFVGRISNAPWPDTLPLSYLIQTLFPAEEAKHTRHDSNSSRNSRGCCPSPPSAADAGDANDIAITRTNTQVFNRQRSEEEACECCAPPASDLDPEHNIDSEISHSPSPEKTAKTEQQQQQNEKTVVARKRSLTLLTAGTLVYHVVLSYVSPVFKSLCLLCFALPGSEVVGSLGSGWNGTGILSVTFDWAAITALQPFVTPVWAQIQYLAGAMLMLYVLTPIGWRMDWWGARNLPAVSTNVFDITGAVYNITVVDQLGASYRQGPQRIYDPYSPVRLTANSALAYVFSVAAAAAVVMHLALWHPRWSLAAARSMAHALLALWDPRPLIRQVRRHGRSTAAWDVKRLAGRAGRMAVFTAAVCVAVASAQLGIAAVPGWQAVLAAVWAMVMSIPTGFVEAMTGFSVPTDLVPHILAGWMDGPGHPIENGYFHLWATAPVRVALGWSGVRSLQLAHSCCFAQNKEEKEKEQTREIRPPRLPWMRRGLLVGLVWGACINHISYTAFSNSLEQTQIILPPSPADQAEPETSSAAMNAQPLSLPPLGWHEEGEFGRLPAALSSELVVWGIVGPRALFSKASPYRLLFLYGALVGVGAPLVQYAAYRALARVARRGRRRRKRRVVGSLALAARSIELPLVLTGMVAVPTVPANFVISGLAVAVGAHVWCSRRRTTLVDKALYNAAMDTGVRLAVAALFAAGQVMATQRRPLVFASWWGNHAGNVEWCRTKK